MSDALPRVSIVTISFNQARFLEEAIQSVIYQDYPNIEYIVVDPGSTDGSRDIIERYRDRISKIIYEPDEGPADGLNKGFAQATGSIFGYINADDYFLQGAIEHAVKELAKRKKIGCVFGNAWIIDGGGNPVRFFPSELFCLALYASGNCVIAQQATFFRREAFELVGGFSTENEVSWDGELVLEMAMAGVPLKRVWATLGCLRVGHPTVSSSQRFRLAAERDKVRARSRVVGRVGRAWCTIGRSRLSKYAADPVGTAAKAIDRAMRFCGLRYSNIRWTDAYQERPVGFPGAGGGAGRTVVVRAAASVSDD